MISPAFAASTAKSRPVLIGVAVLIVLLLSILGFSSPSDGLDGFSLSNHTQSYLPYTKTSAKTKPPRDVLLYAYYETEEAKKNFQFFVNHALHSKMDFVLIVNGNELTVDIPEADNIIVHRRANTCFDLGAFGEVLSANNFAIKKKYDRFILMNASIRGPFLPTWALNMGTCWSDVFLNALNDKTKLIGLAANCNSGLPKHLQSMLLAVDSIGLDIIMPGLQCAATLGDAVMFGEAAIAMMIREAGFEVEPVYTTRHKSHFATSEEFWSACDNGDVFFPNANDGMDIHPFETLFVKTDRKAMPLLSDAGHVDLNTLTKWVDDSKFSSYDYCHA